MTGSRVLWLARMLPVPLNAGDRIYTARLAGALARAGARVRFTGLANPEEPALGTEALDPTVDWRAVPGRPRAAPLALLSRRPLVGARFGTRRYAHLLATLLEQQEWDAIVVDQYGMGWALPLIGRRAAGRPVIVHVAHDFETEVTRDIARAYRGNPLRKMALQANARRTARAERAIARSADLMVTLTERDRDLFRDVGARGTPLILPPGYDGPRRADRVITAGTPRRVAIVGSYRWTAKQMNLAAFLEQADAPFAAAGIELVVIGDAPDAFRASRVGRLRATRFLGFVDSLSDALADCRMGLVIEAVGGGFKLKVLDYVMTRTPVAALAPALGGQAPDVTANFLVADDAAALVAAIVAAIDDRDRLNAMQDGAFRAAAARYDWDANGRALLDAIVEERTTRAGTRHPS